MTQLPPPPELLAEVIQAAFAEDLKAAVGLTAVCKGFLGFIKDAVNRQLQLNELKENRAERSTWLQSLVPILDDAAVESIWEQRPVPREVTVLVDGPAEP